ncbi:hypothetical protein HHI36_016947 [Cryptolaemus montrouzieri]|uniref:Uncharacterized protein n=1 Tax=Cryptolaemus montrouzieri TaxID=559131 RepID=A0ABD2NL31_9CUCU
MNKELAQIVDLTVKKEDVRYEAIQNQFGHSLSALSQGISSILEDTEKIPKELREKLLTSLWYAGKLQTDLFHKITNLRRTLLILILSKSIREVAGNISPDKFFHIHILIIFPSE